MPNIYIIGGPNGSGKTTVSLKLLPNFLECFEYVNADAIAAGMSQFNPESVAILAGGLMIQRLRTLSDSGTDFAFETTLAARNFARFLSNCKTKGYTINLIYFGLQSPEMAIERVQQRVESGRHSIPEDVIRRRYDRGRRNLTSLYLPLCDRWIVYDNSRDTIRLIAEGSAEDETLISDRETWNRIIN